MARRQALRGRYVHRPTSVPLSLPRLLDLFCGAGGAAMGYHRAGFEVVGVDVMPQPNYPFKLVERDALRVLRDWPLAHDFDVIHASPPCQAYSTARLDSSIEHPELIEPVRACLREIGLPYVIENVPGAPMQQAFLLCGVTFGLPLIRHRLFEVWPGIGLQPSLCPQKSWQRGVDHGPGVYSYAHGKWRPAWRKHVLPAVWPWMTLEESGEAIPPAYTEHIGRELLDVMGCTERTKPEDKFVQDIP